MDSIRRAIHHTIASVSSFCHRRAPLSTRSKRAKSKHSARATCRNSCCSNVKAAHRQFESGPEKARRLMRAGLSNGHYHNSTWNSFFFLQLPSSGISIHCPHSSTFPNFTLIEWVAMTMSHSPTALPWLLGGERLTAFLVMLHNDNYTTNNQVTAVYDNRFACQFKLIHHKTFDDHQWCSVFWRTVRRGSFPGFSVKFLDRLPNRAG